MSTCDDCIVGVALYQNEGEPEIIYMSDIETLSLYNKFYYCPRCGCKISERKKLMNFSEALELIKAGKRVARKGWNGFNMFLYLVPGSKFTVNRPPLNEIYPEGTEIEYHAHIDMKTAQGYCVPWLASQADLLADDWFEVTA